MKAAPPSGIGRQRPAKQNQSSPALVNFHFVFGDLVPVNSKKCDAGIRQRPFGKRRPSERKLMTGGPFGLAGGKPQRSCTNSSPSSGRRMTGRGVGRPDVVARLQVRRGLRPAHRDAGLAEGRQIVAIGNVVAEIVAHGQTRSRVRAVGGFRREELSRLILLHRSNTYLNESVGRLLSCGGAAKRSRKSGRDAVNIRGDPTCAFVKTAYTLGCLMRPGLSPRGVSPTRRRYCSAPLGATRRDQRPSADCGGCRIRSASGSGACRRSRPAGLDRQLRNPNTGPEFGEFLRRSYRNEAGVRQYRLYVPSGYRGEPAPLVVLLHGCKQSPEDFAAGTRMNAHAERLGWLAAYPEQSSTANGSRCWNWFRPEDQQRGRGEPALVAGITQRGHERLRDRSGAGLYRRTIRGRRSRGCHGVGNASWPGNRRIIRGSLPAPLKTFLRLAAMRHGERRGTGGMMPIVPMIVFHGDRDRTVNPQNAEMILAQAAAGIELDKHVARGQVPGGHAYTLTRYTDRAGRVLLEYWLVHDAGHAWAGGSSDVSTPIPMARMRPAK